MASGLDGVVAAETILSHADRERGMLWVRGVAVPELVASHGFEGTVALLWQDFAGDDLTREGITASLGTARTAAFAARDAWGGRPLNEGMRLALASLPDNAPPATIVATLAVAVPVLLRGEATPPPDPALSVAADLLRMMHGRPLDAAAVAALDTYFTVMAESGLSASSFAARVIASTRASLVCATLGAWCAFTGPIHGGAPGPTLDLLDAAKAANAAGDLDGWIERKLLAGERLMGFGHRVFLGNDPRAEAMRGALRQMGSAAGRLAFAEHVERRVAAVLARVKPGRSLPANVEIAAALLLDAVKVPREAFTPVFAVSRCAGWLAHAMEQQKTGRMIRPTSRYVGAHPPAAG